MIVCQQELAAPPQKFHFLKCFDWFSFHASQVISFVQLLQLQSPTASTDPAIVCNLQYSQACHPIIHLSLSMEPEVFLQPN